jgi:dTDP-glucose pyrophosphorylase
VGEQFIGKDSVTLVLGDNIFYGHGMTGTLKAAVARTAGATIFGYWVKDPTSYGVVEFDGHGKAWLDTGTYEGLMEAGNFVQTVQNRQGLYVACIEEIAFRSGWINESQLVALGDGIKTEYGEYLKFMASSR